MFDFVQKRRLKLNQRLIEKGRNQGFIDAIMAFDETIIEVFQERERRTITDDELIKFNEIFTNKMIK